MNGVDAGSGGGIEPATLWTAIILLGLCTYLLRGAPILLQGGRPPSAFVGRVLRYVPAAVMPAIAAPMLAFDASGATQSDPARLIAAGVALTVGAATRSLIWTILSGLGALWSATAALALIG
jgi:branched-subunit amino acid transport protein